MTPQEQQMIDGLIDRIRNTQITDRDPQAAAHLQQGLGNNPDAIYILAQTVLVQQHSLEQAHAQLEQMEAQMQQRDAQPAPFTPQSSVPPPPSEPTSWLSRFFGTPPSQPAQPYPQSQPAQPSYATPPPAYQPVNTVQPPYGSTPGYGNPAHNQPMYAPQPMYGMGQQPSGGGSFLRNAAQTAAGVAAGALLFEGVESMFGGHSGYGGGFGHEGGSVVNNYYEDRSPSEHHATDTSDSSFYNPSHDASRDAASQDDLTPTGPMDMDFADNSDSNDAGDASDSYDSDSFDTGSSSDDN